MTTPTFLYLTTTLDIHATFAGLEALTHDLKNKLPKMKKVKAIAEFNVRTATDFDEAKSVMWNIDNHFATVKNALDARYIVVKAQEDEAAAYVAEVESRDCNNEELTEEAGVEAQIAADEAEADAFDAKATEIEKLIAQLESTKNGDAKKVIRNKLRKLGYRRSDHK